MENYYELDHATYQLFSMENKSWQSSISQQVSEIPVWKDMLMAGGSCISEQRQQNENNGRDILYSQLYHQQMQMTKLEEDIKAQQQRLTNSFQQKHTDDIESLCIQDILRHRIGAIEKTYIDLKCNFLQYLSKRI
ncbi:hypothetical protein [Ferruginibacter sp.]